ncbi:MAG: serine/threonine-protein kinase [Acidobacteriota bacterium]
MTRHGEWARIKERFNEALELEGDARAEYLVQLRRREPELGAEVASLVASHEDPETLVAGIPETTDLAGFVSDDGGQDPTVELLSDFDGSLVGRSVGSYRLERLLGRGGMGAVYLGRRTDGFDQKVAVKLVQPRHKQVVLERFLDERQILADLDHPNIARLLDGGTTEDAFPYLVLEYIEGVPIDEYCDLHQLPLEDRVRLLATVCSAVHYAHQNLVVHRDLKPSNILVTKQGNPKLLDFGIAKLLNPDLTPADGRTRMTQAPMTPEYASPEQFLGEPVSTASDVYVLGVLAYRVFTGHSPYHLQERRLEKLARAVCVEPVAPASEAALRPKGDTLDIRRRPEDPKQLSRLLTGDLDAILAKALAKDPLARYGSAEDLGRELGRVLDHRPVEVRGRAFRYVVGRWVERHRGWVVAATLLFVSLLGALGVSVHHARTAAAVQRQLTQDVVDARSALGDLHVESATESDGAAAWRHWHAARDAYREALRALESAEGDGGEGDRQRQELRTAVERCEAALERFGS